MSTPRLDLSVRSMRGTSRAGGMGAAISLNLTVAVHGSAVVVGDGCVEPPAETDCGAGVILIDGELDIIGELVH